MSARHRPRRTLFLVYPNSHKGFRGSILRAASAAAERVNRSARPFTKTAKFD